MQVDLYTATGSKKGTLTLPASVFEVSVNKGLLHQAVVRDLSNRRASIAHTQSRGEIRGSTRKLFSQKGTGRARRGSIRANILRGGNKSFGPKNNTNYTKSMPRKMWRKALLGSLSLQAKNGAIVGLESYPEEAKTKTMAALLSKLPVEQGRPILFVLPQTMKGLTLSVRNVPNARALLVQFLTPEAVLHSRHVVFLADAVKRAEELFASAPSAKSSEEREPKKASKAAKKTTKKTTKKSTSASA